MNLNSNVETIVPAIADVSLRTLNSTASETAVCLLESYLLRDLKSAPHAGRVICGFKSYTRFRCIAVAASDASPPQHTKDGGQTVADNLKDHGKYNLYYRSTQPTHHTKEKRL